MDINLTEQQRKRLTQFYLDLQQAEGRLQLAEQTIQGARMDHLNKRARFAAAVEFVGGVGAAWNMTEDGITVTEAPEQDSESLGRIVADNVVGLETGPAVASEMVPVVNGNHDTRRRAAAKLGLMPEFKARRRTKRQ